MQKKTNKSIIRPFDGIRRAYMREETKHVNEPQVSPQKSILFGSFKVIGTMIFAIILLTSLTSVGGTVAYFNDVEHAIANRLQVGKLFLTLTGGYDDNETS